MDATEFISVSAKLVGWGKAGARSAVSRAYYGAFHLACELLRDLSGETLGSGIAHNLAVQFLGSADHVNAKAAARLLGDLHSHRIRADYRLLDPHVEQMEFAQRCVEHATEVQRQLAAFLQACDSDPAARERLVAGISQIKAAYKS
jgi:hypothetical protein